MIRILTPYTRDKDLGAYYNREMEALPEDDDWCVFVDGDSMFTTPTFGQQLEDIFEAYPFCGLFTCKTNRVGTDYQCVEGMFDETDMRKHFLMGKKLQQEMYDFIVDITDSTPLSGVLIALRKDIWKKSGGFKEGLGMLGVDNSIHYAVRDAGEPVFMMKGVYVLHNYRMLNGVQDKSHLI